MLAPAPSLAQCKSLRIAQQCQFRHPGLLSLVASEGDASKEAQCCPRWDEVGNAAGALPPQPRGTIVTSKGVKVI